jgi:hypothetical protein
MSSKHNHVYNKITCRVRETVLGQQRKGEVCKNGGFLDGLTWVVCSKGLCVGTQDSGILRCCVHLRGRANETSLSHWGHVFEKNCGSGASGSHL